VKLVDDAGNEVPPGEVGEILARPREPFAMFAGYWGKDPATFPGAEVWHETGDLARFDDGYLVFMDRKKDAMRRRGENISSVEVEAALTTDSAVAEAAVFGVPSELTEDDIMVVCVPATGAEITPEDFFALCVERLPYFAIPRYLEVADALPRNAVNRVMKHQLRDRGVTARTKDLQALGLTVDRAARRSSSTKREVVQ
jgi:crotonobetaine/carnitine-CoA ligase